MAETTRSPVTISRCWRCIDYTLHDEDGCEACRARERAAHRYNVEQEMLHGPRRHDWTDGLCVGVILTTLAYFLLHVIL